MEPEFLSIKGEKLSISCVVSILEALKCERYDLFEFLAATSIVSMDAQMSQSEMTTMFRQLIRQDYLNFASSNISSASVMEKEDTVKKYDDYTPSAPFIDSKLPPVPPLIQTLSFESHQAYLLSKELDELERNITKTFYCQICLEDQPVHGSFTLQCNHRFCQDGLSGYICSKINSNQVSEEDMVCPTPGCKVPLSHATIRACTKDIGNADALDKYDSFSTERYIEESVKSGNGFRCPNERCTYAFQWRPDSGAFPFDCPVCKQSYCLSCQVLGVVGGVGPSHAPYTCAQQIERMQEIAEERKKFEQWQVLNARANELFEESLVRNGWKRCPNCTAVIEKNEGCDHMTCKKCKCNFCFVCGKYNSSNPTSRGDCGSRHV